MSLWWHRGTLQRECNPQSHFSSMSNHWPNIRALEQAPALLCNRDSSGGKELRQNKATHPPQKMKKK